MILIDTTPLVALCDTRDSRHRTAIAHLDALASAEFRVCEAVIVEACFHLSHRSQRQRLRALLDQLDATLPPDTNQWTFCVEVFEWLEKYADHEPDWADGCVAVLSGRDRKLKLWTYDREFSTIWRRPNGTPVPLAIKP